MRYLMIHCIDEAVDEHLPRAEAEAWDAGVAAWDTEMKARGVLRDGARLAPVSAARTVRVRGGEVLVSDGPFAETKEQIAGVTVLECADLDEAIEAASRHPTASYGTFELRPLCEP